MNIYYFFLVKALIIVVLHQFEPVDGSASGATTTVSPRARGSMTKDDSERLLAEIISESKTDIEKSIYGFAKAKYGVKTMTLTFETTHDNDVKKKETALVAMPGEGATGKYPTIIYNHKDIAYKNLLPTASILCNVDTYVLKSWEYLSCDQKAADPNAAVKCCNFLTSYRALASFWAMQGFIVVMPDYLGNGAEVESPPKVPAAYQKDLYVKSILSALEAVVEQGIAEQNTQLLLAGFSEGAYAAIEVQKAFDTQTVPTKLKKFNLLATFAHALPYNFKKYAQDTMKTFATTTAGAGNIYDDMWRGPRILMAGIENGQNKYQMSSCFQTGSNTDPANVFKSMLTSQQCCMTIKTDPNSPFLDSSKFFLDLNMASAMKERKWPAELNEAVITRNELNIDWKPKGKTFLCSTTNNLVVPEYHAQEAYDAYAKAYGDSSKVTWDRFAGTNNAHIEAEASCLLVTQSVLLKTDWMKAEDEYLNGVKIIKIEKVAEPLPLLLIFVICVISPFVLLGLGCCIYPLVTGKKCPSLCEVWVGVLVKCAVPVLILGLLGTLAISIYGAYSSNWKIEVDSNFAGYMSAESELKAELDMFEVAKNEQTLTIPAPVKKRMRMLTEANDHGRMLSETTKQSIGPLWKLDIFYEARTPDKKHGIFYKDALEEIKSFEQKLVKFVGYNDYCLKKHYNPGKECDLPMSVINLMYGSTEINGTSTTSTYNGAGTLQDVETVLKSLAKEGAFWYTDASFSPTNLTSQFTRSQFEGGLPLKGFKSLTKENLKPQEDLHKGWLKTLYKFLLDESKKSKHITITWYDPWFLRDYEVREQLYHDALFSLGSFTFVAGFVLLHLESIFLSVIAMTSILMSFPMAYYIFYNIAGVKTMMLLNFVSLFLIMGIGADDVFVMFDTFHQSKAALPDGKKDSMKHRMLWTYKEAGGAMLITTVTTVGSFYSNCLSTVRVVKEFGLYMGSVVVFNFINVMILFPAALIIYHDTCGKIKIISRLKSLCCKRKSGEKQLTAVSPASSSAEPGGRRKRGRKKGSLIKKATQRRVVKATAALNPEDLNVVEKAFYYGFSNCLKKLKYFIIFLSFGLAITAGVMAALTFKASSGPPVVFQEEHNLGRIERLLRTAFSATSMEDMEKAASAFPSDKPKVKQTCPGKVESGAFCNGQGDCDETSLLCTCYANFVGLDCSEKKQTGAILTDKTSLEWTFYGEDITGKEESFVFKNIGDDDVKWSLKFKGAKPNYVISTIPMFSDTSTASGTVAKRGFDSNGATLNDVTIKIKVNTLGLSEGETNTVELELSSIIGKEAGTPIIITLKVYSAPLTPALMTSFVQVDGSNNVAIPKSSFTGNTVEVVYRYEKITIKATSQTASDAVVLFIDNTKIEWGTAAGTSFEKKDIQLEVDKDDNKSVKKEIVLNVTRTAPGGLSKTTSYPHTFIRLPAEAPSSPSIDSVKSSKESELTIALTKPSKDGGANIIEYECFTTPGGIRGTSSTTTVMMKNLVKTQAYRVNCTAKNDADKISASSALKPDKEADAITADKDAKPVISANPVVVRKPGSNTEVSVTALYFSVGGARLKEIVCTSTPGSVSGTSNSRITNSNPLSITGLNIDQNSYTFSCIVENENNVKSLASGNSNQISSQQPEAPKTFSVTEGDKKLIVSSLAASDGVATPNFRCKALFGTDGIIEKIATYPTTTMTFTGLTNGESYNVQCQCQNSAGYGDYSDQAATNAKVPYGKPTNISSAPVVQQGVSIGGEITVRVTTPQGNGATLTDIKCVSTPGNNMGTISDPNGLTLATYDIGISGLNKGLSYTIKCRGSNKGGDGHYSAPSSSWQPASVPDKVKNMAVAYGTQNSVLFEVTFDKPDDEGGLPITGYECTCCTSLGSCETAYSGTSLVHTFLSLTEERSYTIECLAVNSKGKGAKDSKTLVAGRKPFYSHEKPGATASSDGTKGNIKVNFIKSNSDTLVGGLPYKYACRGTPTTTGDIKTITDKESSDFPITFTELDPAKTYQFDCMLTNAAGDGAYGTKSAEIRPVVPPNAPSFDLTGMKRLNGKCSMKLTAPTDDGGDAISQCRCISSDGSVISESSTANPLQWEIDSLSNGLNYQFLCACKNGYLSAYGTNTSTLSRVCTPKDPPGPTAPTNVKAVSSAGKISVTFGAPIDNGEFAISKYECGAFIGNTATFNGASQPSNTNSAIEIINLSDGTNYTVVCRAVSNNGVNDVNGDESVAIYSVPSNVPGKCGKSTNIVVAKGKLMVTAVKPETDGGDRIKGYKCTAFAAGKTSKSGTVTLGPDTLVVEISGLENGVAYATTCEAENSAGPGTPSDASDPVTPIGAPDAPPKPVIQRAGSGKIKVTFAAPNDNGGNAITLYTCYAYQGTTQGVKVESSSVTPVYLNGLSNGQSYTAKCKCKNEEGDSTLSVASDALIAADKPDKISSLTSVQTMRSEFTVTIASAPASNGQSISKYVCSAAAEATDGTQYTDNTKLTGESTSTTVVITSAKELKANSQFKITCVAENVVGQGDSSDEIIKIVENVPGVPTISIKPGDGSIYVRANTSSYTGTSKLSKTSCTLYDYNNKVDKSQIVAKTGGIFEYTWDTTTTYKVANGRTYVAKCFATSSIGDGITSPDSLPARAGVVMKTTLTIVQKTTAPGTTSLSAETPESKIRKALAEALSTPEAAIYIDLYSQHTSGNTVTVIFNTMLNSAADYVDAKNKALALGSSVAFKSSVNAESIEIENPKLLSDGYTKSDLSDLSITSNGNTIAMPNFAKTTKLYKVNITQAQFAETITINAVSHTSHASMSVTKYSTSGIASSFVTSNVVTLRDVSIFNGDVTNVYVRVYSAECKDSGDTTTCGDDKFTQYNIKVGRMPLSCPSCADAKYCNPYRKNEDGQANCICPSSEYKGRLCEVYCPIKNGKECNGQGVCDTTVAKRCVCSSTYAGAGCVERTCPKCNATGVTNEMELMLSKNECSASKHTCQCRDGFSGDSCEVRTCFKDCHSQGKCNSGGTCECYKGYKGEFCETKLPRQIPLMYAVEISLVYGIEQAASNNKTKPIYSQTTDFKSTDAQNYLLSVCNKAINMTDFNLLVREDYPCWISAFKQTMESTNQVFPVSKTLFPSLLDTFFNANNALAVYKKDIGTSGEKYEGKVQFTALTFKINVDGSIGALGLQPYHKEWVKFVELLNKDPPEYIGKVRMISSAWTKMDTELGIIISTITSYFSSNAICLICVLIFTGDLVISLFAMLSIFLIVTTLMGFLFAVLGYTFGAIEAVGVTIFVGMSVDYALHMAHGYHSAHGENRFDKVRDALTHLGISIIGGAVTTAGAAVFLFFCHMYLFIQLGTMMFMNTVLALFFSLIFLSTMLMVAGPLNHNCDIYALLGAIKKKICDCKKKNSKVGIAMEEKAINPEVNIVQRNDDEEYQEQRRNNKKLSNVDDAWDV